MALNTRTRYVHLIITCESEPKKQQIDALKDWLEKNTDFYAYIYHDLDTKLKDGQQVLKTPHYHCVFLLKPSLTKNKEGEEKKQYARFSTIINQLEETTHFNTMAMTISHAKDWIGNCRYLLHLDSTTKHRYDVDAVITSDMTMYNNYISSPSEVLTSASLYSILESCNYSLYLIIENLGLDRYKKYRLVIQDICKSMFKTLEK